MSLPRLSLLSSCPVGLPLRVSLAFGTYIGRGKKPGCCKSGLHRGLAFLQKQRELGSQDSQTCGCGGLGECGWQRSG